MTTIPTPAKGADILPWAVAVTNAIAPVFGPARGLVRSGAFGDGVEPLPENLRDRAGEEEADPLPFAVRIAVSQPENAGDEPALSAQIYLPADALVVDGAAVAVAETPGWCDIDGFDATSASLWLNVSFSDDDPPEISAALSLDEKDDDAALAVKIAAFSASGASVAVAQLVAGALVVSSPSSPDGLSLSVATGEEPHLQIKDFDSARSDSPRGLAQRLAFDKDSGKISASGAGGIALVARRDGKILYIPISADGSDPDDRDRDEPDGDPCEHPEGGAAGVSADDSDGQAAPGQAAPSSAGGVPAGGDAHAGDDDCNC